mgnify:CR=1 FL=1
MRPDRRRRQDDLENAFEIVTTKAKPFSKTFEDCVEPSGKAHGIVADLIATEFKPKTDTAFADYPEIPKAMATVYCYSTRGDLRVGKARAKTFEGWSTGRLSPVPPCTILTTSTDRSSSL